MLSTSPISVTARLLGLAALLALAFSSSAIHAAPVIQPKVMVIATYEIGQDTGDAPGELQYWVEREHLTQAIKVPGIDHPILTNGTGLYAMICGTTSRCAVQMMTLAMDPQFDLRKTYFLLGGIAGVDPKTGTLGSAAWIQQVVDGDPTFEIDSRETPASWPYGIVALGATAPNQIPPDADTVGVAGISGGGAGDVGKPAFQLNPSLVGWAYQLTKDVKIPDNTAMAARRALYKDQPMAQAPPTVLEGASLGADRFWTGAIMNHWAEDWVRLYTHGTGTFIMSDCEDQALCLAMAQLTRLGHVDNKRFLILRTASDFTVPPPGVDTAKNLFDDLTNTPGYLPALESDYRVGSLVVAALLKDWPHYRDTIP
jgi:purine nucleoside permease